ncbi:hypothetical protein ACVWYQ_004027 [Bradyrhizobium sp. USDA 3397]
MLTGDRRTPSSPRTIASLVLVKRFSNEARKLVYRNGILLFLYVFWLASSQSKQYKNV